MPRAYVPDIRVVICILVLFIYMKTVVDQLPRLGKRELICLLLFTCNYVVSVWRGFLFLCSQTAINSHNTNLGQLPLFC